MKTVPAAASVACTALFMLAGLTAGGEKKKADATFEKPGKYNVKVDQTVALAVPVKREDKGELVRLVVKVNKQESAGGNRIDWPKEDGTAYLHYTPEKAGTQEVEVTVLYGPFVKPYRKSEPVKYTLVVGK